jgi:hypothetical protein
MQMSDVLNSPNLAASIKRDCGLTTENSEQVFSQFVWQNILLIVAIAFC